MRLVHLSDLHFGQHDSVVTATLAAELEQQKPDLIVISGDFTQRGIEAEFRVARDFIDTLSAPVFAVPGNHDVPQANFWRRFTDPYRLYRKYIDDEMEPFLELGGVALAGLKTAHRMMPELNWSHGSLSRNQLAALSNRFAVADATSLRVIVAHHPLLYPDGDHGVKQHRVRRADQALETFAQLGVRLVLSGHFHLSYVRVHEHPGETKAGAPTGLRKAAAAPILVAQTSSTISTRLRGHPNSYNLIDIEAGEITIGVRQWTGKRWVLEERNSEPARGDAA